MKGKRGEEKRCLKKKNLYYHPVLGGSEEAASLMYKINSTVAHEKVPTEEEVIKKNAKW